MAYCGYSNPYSKIYLNPKNFNQACQSMVADSNRMNALNNVAKPKRSGGTIPYASPCDNPSTATASGSGMARGYFCPFGTTVTSIIG